MKYKKKFLLETSFIFINGREDRIWTCNPLVPNQVLYQIEPFPVYGAPDRSWTHNLLIRSQMLYPIELWARLKSRRNRFTTSLLHL